MPWQDDSHALPGDGREERLNAPKVMVLDNQLMDVIAVQKSLEEAGYVVVKLTSPNGVLAKIDYERPDVLLVNPWMPRLDVPELVATLAMAPEFQDMVVVAIGEQDAATLQAFCIEHDLHGYFSKTMDLTGVGEFLTNFFEDEE